MKTLRQKILAPMVLLIVLVPLATLLFFNIAMRIYMERAAVDDLKEAVLPVETLAQQNLGESGAPLSGKRLDFAAVALTKAVQSSRLTGARLLLFDGRSQMIYPKTVPDGFVSAELARRVAAQVKLGVSANKVAHLRIRGADYLMCGFVLSAAGDRLSVVLVSQLDVEHRLIQMTNVLLVIIMLTGIAVGVFVAGRIAKKMSRHVGGLCDATARIGGGDFAPTPREPSDIAEFRALSQSVERMAERLGASENAQRAFLQNASHELRTPLMSIQGYAEGIAGGVVPNVKEAAGIIGSESRRLNALVEELLTLSRIESRTADKALVPLNLRELLPDYAQRLGGIAMKREKQLVLDLPELPVRVLGDEELLGQAVTNIVSNCLRYARRTVRITLLRGEEYAVVRIGDDGPGIPEADLPHLFERFYKGKGGNFGLGLAIARSAVRVLGGGVRACNGPEGALFDIILPLAPQEGG